MEPQQKKPVGDEVQRAISVYKTMKSIDKAAAFKKVIYKIGKGKAKRRRMVFLYSCAAALVLSLMTGSVWLYIIHYQNSSTIEIPRITGNIVLQLPNGAELVLDENQSETNISDIDVLIAQNMKEREAEYASADSPPDALPAPEYSTLIVYRGNRYNMILKDGTHVWLNAESNLRFPNYFVGGERRVYLQGEAYFAVTQNAEQPFIVETDEQIATVLGTELNIFAYSGASGVYTTLVSGSVSLASKSSDATVVLKPGEQALLKPGSEDYLLSKVNATELASWRTNKFVFDGNTLEEAFMKMARWYDFAYHFEDVYVAGLELMGSIPIYDNIDTVLQFIKDLGMVQIERKGTIITISNQSTTKKII